jgi:hypothetical protein
MKRAWSIVGAALTAWVLFAAVVMAQEVVVPETVVNFRWGDLVGVFLTNLADNPESGAWTLLGLALTWIVSQLPGPLKWFYNMYRVEQLLRNAVMGAINSTKGAVAGKSLGVDVGSEVFAKALQYAVDNGNGALIQWAGGTAGLTDKLIARIPTTEAVTGADLVSKAVAPVAVVPPVGKPLTAAPDA